MNTHLENMCDYYAKHGKHNNSQIQQARDLGIDLYALVADLHNWRHNEKLATGAGKAVDSQISAFSDFIYGTKSESMDWPDIHQREMIRRGSHNSYSAEFLKVTSGILKQWVEVRQWVNRSFVYNRNQTIKSTIEDSSLFEPVKRSWE